jgi:methylmalonyl-CoA/ethylmalonyl-CoA epimerase
MPVGDGGAPIAGLHHVGILVADLAAAESFATQVLGLTVAKRASIPDESTEIVFLRCGDVEIELIEISDPAALSRRRRVPDAAVEIEHLAFAVDDVEAAAEQLAGLGLRFTAGAGKREESAVPLEVAGTRSLFTVRESAAGFLLQLIETSDVPGDAG